MKDAAKAEARFSKLRTVRDRVRPNLIAMSRNGEIGIFDASAVASASATRGLRRSLYQVEEGQHVTAGTVLCSNGTPFESDPLGPRPTVRCVFGDIVEGSTMQGAGRRVHGVSSKVVIESKDPETCDTRISITELGRRD